MMQAVGFGQAKQPPQEASRQKGSAGAAAQKKVQASPAPEGAKNEDSKKTTLRLPKVYAQLELDEKQQSQIAAIHESYRAKSAELRKQIDALRAKRDEDISRALKPNQRDQLKELTAQSQTKSARSAKSDARSGPDREKKATEVSKTAKR
jgi:Spy/CpxP family protein refolding chaperone